MTIRSETSITYPVPKGHFGVLGQNSVHFVYDKKVLVTSYYLISALREECVSTWPCKTMKQDWWNFLILMPVTVNANMTVTMSYRAML
jgi:hypothetical protein